MAIDALKGPSAQASSGKADSVVVMLHGSGANGRDIIGLAPFYSHILPGAAFYAPNAPYTRDDGGYVWVPAGPPRDLFAPTPKPEEVLRDAVPGADESAKLVDAYLDQILAHHQLPASRMALLGFSQGTMMTFHVGLRRAGQLAGLVCYAGAVRGVQRLAAEIRSKPPVIVILGDQDAMPFATYAETKKVMDGLQVPCETLVIPGLGHAIDSAAAQAGAEFLKKHLG